MDAAEALFQEFVDGGFDRIEQICNTKEEEHLLLDFKENRGPVGGAQSVLDPSNIDTLAIYISAYANTRGGVLVWGIQAKNGQVPQKRPIPEISLFLESLNTHEYGATDPPVTGVRHIRIDDPSKDGSGYAITYVPDSEQKPHQCCKHKKITSYYTRSGNSCDPMVHSWVQALILAKAHPELNLEVEVRDIQPKRQSVPLYESSGRISTQNYYEVILWLTLTNRGKVAAENCAAAFLESEHLQSGGFGVGSTVTQGDSYVPVRFGPVPGGELLYPGIRVPLGRFVFTFTKTVPIGRFIYSKEPCTIKYWLYARGFTLEAEYVIPAESLPTMWPPPPESI